MPPELSRTAAPSVTVVHAAPDVAPFPQYWNASEPLNEAFARYVKVPSRLRERVPLVGGVVTVTPKILESFCMTPLVGSETVKLCPAMTELYVSGFAVGAPALIAGRAAPFALM